MRCFFGMPRYGAAVLGLLLIFGSATSRANAQTSSPAACNAQMATSIDHFQSYAEHRDALAQWFEQSPECAQPYEQVIEVLRGLRFDCVGVILAEGHRQRALSELEQAAPECRRNYEQGGLVDPVLVMEHCPITNHATRRPYVRRVALGTPWDTYLAAWEYSRLSKLASGHQDPAFFAAGFLHPAAELGHLAPQLRALIRRYAERLRGVSTESARRLMRTSALVGWARSRGAVLVHVSDWTESPRSDEWRVLTALDALHKFSTRVNAGPSCRWGTRWCECQGTSTDASPESQALAGEVRQILNREYLRMTDPALRPGPGFQLSTDPGYTDI